MTVSSFTITSSDVAIVGGGVIGLACARELRREGVSSVVLIERQAGAGQGSTARANGGVRAQFSTAVNIEFSRYTIQELEKLDQETGGLPGLQSVGYLLVTGDPQQEDSLRQGYELQRRMGVDVSWLSPSEVMSRAPFLRPDGIRAGTFCGRDGIIDPHGVVQALLAQVNALEVSIRFDSEVTKIESESKRFLLHTNHGRLSVRWLVNAAGPDADDLARLAGVDLPCHAVRRNLACTSPFPGLPDPIPMCVDLDTGVLVRRESGGFLIAYSDPSDSPSKDTTLDPRFLEQIAERIGNRFPFLEEAGIHEKNCWAGLYPETPDHHAIVGPTPKLPHFLQCVGFGGHGIMHSLAAGRAIAEIVARGRSETIDVHPLRFSRFEEGDLVVESAFL